MADLTFVLILLAFFGVAVALVAACDRIIGPDPATDADGTPTDDAVTDDATTTLVGGRS